MLLLLAVAPALFLGAGEAEAPEAAQQARVAPRTGSREVLGADWLPPLPRACWPRGTQSPSVRGTTLQVAA